MMDFAKSVEESKNFIVDIVVDDDKMTIKYADGHEETEKLSRHNLNVYRLNMERQASNNMNYAYDTLAKDSFMIYAKRIMAIVGGIVAGIVIYNIDVHLIMKIILALLILFSEVIYYLYNEVYLTVLADDLSEIEATDYYLKNINSFKYYDTLDGEIGYILPIEDIDKYDLTLNQLEQIDSLVKQFREDGVENRDIFLTYKKHND